MYFVFLHKNNPFKFHRLNLNLTPTELSDYVDNSHPLTPTELGDYVDNSHPWKTITTEQFPSLKNNHL